MAFRFAAVKRSILRAFGEAPLAKRGFSSTALSRAIVPFLLADIGEGIQGEEQRAGATTGGQLRSLELVVAARSRPVDVFEIIYDVHLTHVIPTSNSAAECEVVQWCV